MNSQDKNIKLKILQNLPCLYFYFSNSSFDFVELCASLTKEDNLETIKTVAVGMHELLSISKAEGKDPFEFQETLTNIMEEPKAWLCLVSGLDITVKTLVEYFI